MCLTVSRLSSSPRSKGSERVVRQPKGDPASPTQQCRLFRTAAWPSFGTPFSGDERQRELAREREKKCARTLTHAGSKAPTSWKEVGTHFRKRAWIYIVHPIHLPPLPLQLCNASHVTPSSSEPFDGRQARGIERGPRRSVTLRTGCARHVQPESAVLFWCFPDWITQLSVGSLRHWWTHCEGLGSPTTLHQNCRHGD